MNPTARRFNKPMKYAILSIVLSLSAGVSKAQDYISYYLIHVGVDHTLKENGRQKDIKERQVLVGAGEELNRSQMSRFKSLYGKVIERLNKLNLLFDGAFMAVEAYPALASIVRSQQEIISEVQASPYLIPIAVQSETDFVRQAQSVIRYVTGLILTYGDINMMKPADRKMLLNHALHELRALNAISADLLTAIRNIKLAEKLRKAEIEMWINRDREIISDIINNANNLF